TIIDLANQVPYDNTNSAVGFASDYYHFLVPNTPVERRAQFEIDNPSGNLTLVAHRGLPLPDLTTFDYKSDLPDTNWELIVFYDYSSPVALGPGDWYLTALNLETRPVSYRIMASVWPDYGTNIVITNWVISSSNL